MIRVNTRLRGKSYGYYFEIASVNGKRKRITKSGFKTEAEAYKAGVKALEEYETGRPCSVSDMSFSDFLDMWLDKYVKTLKFNTQYNYEKLVRLHIKPALGAKRLRSIDAPTVQAFVNSLAAKGFSRSTIVSIKNVVSGSLAWAVYPAGLIAYNPVQRISIPVYAPKASAVQERIISPEDFQKVLDRVRETPYYIPIMIGYYTGVRIGEAYGLTWDDIDLEARTISISKIQTNRYGQKGFLCLGTPKTKSSYRVIQYGDVLDKALRAQKNRQNADELRLGKYYKYTFLLPLEEGVRQIVSLPKSTPTVLTEGERVSFVCTRQDGEVMKAKSLSAILNVCKVELGITFDFHSLRHAHATALIEAGVSVKEVARRLGHASVETTLDLYTKATPAMADEAVRAFDTFTQAQ